jgi:hypothetical protein
MVARSGVRGKLLAKVLFSLAAFVAFVGTAAAVFPPLYQQPPAQPVAPVVTPTAPTPPVVIVGEPVDPVDPVAPTPEPSTWLTAALGTLFVVGYMRWKRRKDQTNPICG